MSRQLNPVKRNPIEVANAAAREAASGDRKAPGRVLPVCRKQDRLFTKVPPHPSAGRDKS